ncbi:hypothetical protein BH09BAC3_BH09BAC3_35970 [soil metagenome]
MKEVLFETAPMTNPVYSVPLIPEKSVPGVPAQCVPLISEESVSPVDLS